MIGRPAIERHVSIIRRSDLVLSHQADEVARLAARVVAELVHDGSWPSIQMRALTVEGAV
jgi:hypothetical protein